MSRQNADPMLVTEILGVHPQLLLDYIINGANESIYESVDSLEDFLRGWIEGKEKDGADGDELRKEMAQVSGRLKYTRVWRETTRFWGVFRTLFHLVFTPCGGSSREN